jgi:hypothetical protein
MDFAGRGNKNDICVIVNKLLIILSSIKNCQKRYSCLNTKACMS